MATGGADLRPMSVPQGTLLAAVRRCVDYPLCPASLWVWLCAKEQTSLLSVASTTFELGRFSWVQRVKCLCSSRCGGRGSHVIVSFYEIFAFSDFCHGSVLHSGVIIRVILCVLCALGLWSDVGCVVEIINVISRSLVLSVVQILIYLGHKPNVS